jgi:hypothetical protein
MDNARFFNVLAMHEHVENFEGPLNSLRGKSPLSVKSCDSPARIWSVF